MQETIQPPQVNKGPVISNVFNGSLKDDPLLKHLQRLFPKRGTFLLQHCPARYDHIGAGSIIFEDGEFAGFPQELIQVADGTNVHMRAR